MNIPHFNFGKNWDKYSTDCIDQKRLSAAQQSIKSLTGLKDLSGLSFLDVGCGSGLFSIAAAECGASKVVGIDVNPTCIEVSTRNASELRPHKSEQITEFKVGSALDSEFMSEQTGFDIVYAWGSLHHTGNMEAAIKNTSLCVKRPGGMFVLAIYNKHWSSAGWTIVKRLYNVLPRLGQSLMNYTFGAIIFIAKFLVTGKSPTKKERGMDFWFDVIDWLGGYPYEYASAEEMQKQVSELAYSCTRTTSPAAPTGCNEFVFHASYRPADTDS
jgi:2-polyprenyl-3-methyl-5-hydroxy-6-metoxy-1,4-benzoquinol methylase